MIERTNMLMKRIIFILLILFMVSSLISVGCSGEKKEDKVSNGTVESLDVEIIELDKKDPPNISTSEWVSFTEEERFKMSDLIFRGVVTSKKEYVLETKISDEYTRKNYKTVYTMSVSDIYFSTDIELKKGDEVKVLSPTTSYNWDLEAVLIEKDQEFLMFARFTKDTDTYKFTDLAKYSLGNPFEPIVSIKEGKFEMDEVFVSLTVTASLENRKIYDNQFIEVFVRDDENFISDLKDLVDKYKNK